MSLISVEAQLVVLGMGRAMVGIELLIGAVIGGLVSWIMTRSYYKKARFSVPDWAKPIIGKLPPAPPTQQALLELFEGGFLRAEAGPHPVSQRVACPICNAPVSDFKKEVVGDEHHTNLMLECPHCGWSEFVQP